VPGISVPVQPNLYFLDSFLNESHRYQVSRKSVERKPIACMTKLKGALGDFANAPVRVRKRRPTVWLVLIQTGRRLTSKKVVRPSHTRRSSVAQVARKCIRYGHFLCCNSPSMSSGVLALMSSAPAVCVHRRPLRLVVDKQLANEE
jgi:hypothetical protein